MRPSCVVVSYLTQPDGRKCVAPVRNLTAVRNLSQGQIDGLAKGKKVERKHLKST